jgi:hypothetical protein
MMLSSIDRAGCSLLMNRVSSTLPKEERQETRLWTESKEMPDRSGQLKKFSGKNTWF